ncbi:MAG TPA: ComF family protein [Rudaea sp.]|jgi:ComF family protein
MESKSVDGLWGRAQRLILPSHCLLCAQDGDGRRDLCAACAGDLVRNRLCCPRCALPLQAPAPLCGECLLHEPPFDAAFAPFLYGHPIDLLVTKLKFGRSLAAGRVLSELWRDAVADLSPARPDLFVPVPLHASRLRERGYNQALELARPLARALGIPLGGKVLSRTKATAAQSNLDAKARRRNLRGAFTLDPVPLTGAASQSLHIALVDDVMTTGATLRECARMLKRAGVARVDVWALARAPKSR